MKTLAQGPEFDMKYHILNDFGACNSFKEESSDHFKDLHKLKLLKNVYVYLTSSQEEVMNNGLNVQFITSPGDEVRLTSKICQDLQFMQVFSAWFQ